VEATVLDLAATAPRVATALALVADACRLGLTTRDRLARDLERRPTSRHRAALQEAVADAGRGAHSLLELRYLRDVERAHGLPRGTRQRPTASTRQDVHYEGRATTVELDGRRGHEDETARWRDMRRDNASVLRGEATLRYGWADVGTRPCAVATQVAAVLVARGWTGAARRCPRCPAT
jgi:very-short-patch-repair endonuclease